MADLNPNACGSGLYESFDPYAAIADAASGSVPMWRSSASWSLTDGRFPGSQALTSGTNSATLLDAHATGSNDPALILNLSFEQVTALLGSNLGLGVQLLDGTSAQCTLLFQSDGSLIVKSGGAAGSTVATLAGVFTQATWWGYQIRVAIHNTAGSVKVWKFGQDGDPALVTADHEASSINTRGGTSNNYANNIRLVTGAGMASIGSGNQRIDDFHAHNETSGGAAAGPYDLVGDIKCERLFVESDDSVQFSRVGVGKALVEEPLAGGSSDAGATDSVAGQIIFNAMIEAPASGLLDHVVWTPGANHASAKVKVAFYEDDGNTLPGAFLGESAEITGWTGPQDFDFTATAIPVVAGVRYWTAIVTDTLVTDFHAHNSVQVNNTGVHPRYINGTYAGGFPSDGSASQSPSGLTAFVPYASVTPVLAPGGTNWGAVADARQDGTASYVYDATVGHVDQYGLADLESDPEAIVAVVRYGMLAKSDAGYRAAQLRLQSGATTDDSPAVGLTTTPGYVRKSDPVDPDTGLEWDAPGVDALTLGPRVAA